MPTDALRYIPDTSEAAWTDGHILKETDLFIEVTLGDALLYEDASGFVTVQKDYRVNGEVWQVHKSDADPFPSRPHAHCVSGRDRYVGLKLHLGTRQLWDGPHATDILLPRKPFMRLIQLIRPKFPAIELPLPAEL